MSLMTQVRDTTRWTMFTPEIRWLQDRWVSSRWYPTFPDVEAQSTLHEGCLRVGPPFLAPMVSPEPSIAAIDHQFVH